MLVDPTNPPELRLYVWRSYEPDVEAAISATLEQGMVAVDVGANCGVLTLAMRDAVGEDGFVIAVDPSPRACVRVAEQAAANGATNITIVCAAVADQHGEAPFYFGRIGIGALPESHFEFATNEPVSVRLRTLDEVVRSSGVGAVDLIKVDTDGSELFVLRGALETIDEFRPALLFEVSEDGLRRSCSSPAELLSFLVRRNYDFFAGEFETLPRWFARPPRLIRFKVVTRFADDMNVLALHRHNERHREVAERLRGGCVVQVGADVGEDRRQGDDAPSRRDL